jgi:hypothetical protein
VKTYRLILGAAIACTIGAQATPSFADTQYYFSGNACQPTDSTNAAKIQILGAGITNKDTTVLTSATVTCPVSGIISTSIHATGLRVHVRNSVSGFWELDNQIFSTVAWTSNKTTATGGSS